MIRKMICIECPKGCLLSISVSQANTVREVTGNGCPKGKTYGTAEIEAPARVLTSTVLTVGLSLKLVPVRTDRPIPKQAVPEAMRQIQALRIRRPVRVGEVIAQDFIVPGVNLIATRDAGNE